MLQTHTYTYSFLYTYSCTYLYTYPYIHSYVSLCVFVYVLWACAVPSSTQMQYLGAFPTSGGLGTRLSLELPTGGVIQLCGAATWEVEFTSSRCEVQTNTQNFIPPPPSVFQLRSLAALNAMVNAKWSIIGFYRIQQDYHYVVKYGLRVWSVNVLTSHEGWYFFSFENPFICWNVFGKLMTYIAMANAGWQFRIFLLPFLGHLLNF